MPKSITIAIMQIMFVTSCIYPTCVRLNRLKNSWNCGQNNTASAQLCVHLRTTANGQRSHQAPPPNPRPASTIEPASIDHRTLNIITHLRHNTPKILRITSFAGNPCQDIMITHTHTHLFIHNRNCYTTPRGSDLTSQRPDQHTAVTACRQPFQQLN